MNDKYKLVPVEPTPEMLEAGADWCGQGLDTYEAKGRAATAYKFMLAAAPDVQGEPVAWIRKWSLDGEKPTKERNKNGRTAHPMKYKLHEVTRKRCLRDDVALYAAPQPTGQQPAPEVVGWQFYQDGKWWNVDDRTKDHKKNTLAAGFRFRDVYAAQQPAEQPAEQPAPEAGEHRKFTFWAVYDTTNAQKYIKMDADTGCLAIFDVEERAVRFAADCPGTAYGELVLYSCPQPADAAILEAFDAGRRAAQAEVHFLREWIKGAGDQYDICTHQVLGKVCDGCRCWHSLQGGKP